MSDIVERLRVQRGASGKENPDSIYNKAADEIDRLRERCEAYKGQVKDGANEIVLLRGQVEKQKACLNFVDAWVSQPVGAYSVYALDGLFRRTREHIAAATSTERGQP
jgi:hypothetical protein